jgi:large subunit ribosomal protein L25
MSMQAALSAQKREGAGKGVARKLRAAGQVPAVLYGQGTDPVSLTLNAREAEKVFASVSVENTIIDLTIEGDDTVQTLVREIQAHPFRHEILHVDFLLLKRGVSVELDIPVHLAGTARGVRNDGGLLDHVLHDIKVRCIPSLIPDAAELDVSDLGIGDSLHVSDIRLPEGVQILTEGEVLVCSVQPPRLGEEGEEAEEEVDEVSEAE